jgi:hypothetical protein
MSSSRVLITLLVFTFLSLIVNGCKSPNSPIETANLSGTILLIDTMGIRLPSMAGTQIQLENTRYSTVTDSFGNWTLTDVPLGSYVLRYDHNGFGGVRFKNFVIKDTGLHALYTSFLTTPVVQAGYVDSIITESSGGLAGFDVYGRTIASMYSGSYLLFISPDSTFDQFNPQCYLEMRWDASWYGPHCHVPYGSLRQQGIASGTKLYFAFALAGRSDEINLEKYSLIEETSSYRDQGANHSIYTAIGPRGNVMTATMP